ncbi:MAG: hypothetical protein ACYC7A_13065 [Thermoanaerobaculia bacterium]
MNGDRLSLPIDRWRMPALIVGIIGTALTIVGAFINPAQFFQSYLKGFIYIASLSLGCLALLMIHNLTGGNWGVLIRRTLESGVRNLLLVAAAFVPILFGMKHLYFWVTPEAAHDHFVHQKSAYLDLRFFIVRAVIFFAIWIIAGFVLNKWSARFEETADPYVHLRMRGLSAIGLVLMGITLTFASVDWVMSLDPEWYSTMYGISFMVACGLSALTFSIVVLASLAKESPMREMADPMQFRDLGNLTLAFVMLWAYTAYSQYMLIWYGNIREEVPYYVSRAFGEWGILAIILVVFHFFLPFFFLLIRAIKDRPATIAIVAAGLLVMRAVDLHWLIAPTFHEKAFHLHWLDVTAVLGLFGIWLFVFLMNLSRKPYLSLESPLAKEAMSHA